jgi:ssDNA-binding Zn-finger/Zn-ribbon topoisomerase 1
MTVHAKKKKQLLMKFRSIFSTTNWVFYGANAILVYDNKWNTQTAQEMIKKHKYQTRPIRCSKTTGGGKNKGAWRCKKTPPISATTQIKRRQQEQGESIPYRATFHNTTNQIVDCIRLAAFVDLVVFHKDSQFKQKLFHDIVRVTGKKTLSINYLLKTIDDDSFGEKIGKKLHEDQVYSQEQIVELKELLFQLKNNPKLEERLLKYSTDDYEEYMFGNNCEQHTNRIYVPESLPDEEVKKNRKETIRKRLIQKEKQLQMISAEETVLCPKCQRHFTPTQSNDFGRDSRTCGDCNLRKCIFVEQRNRVQTEEKMNQLMACKDVSYHNGIIRSLSLIIVLSYTLCPKFRVVCR